jgi:hypothetical protein
MNIPNISTFVRMARKLLQGVDYPKTPDVIVLVLKIDKYSNTVRSGSIAQDNAFSERQFWLEINQMHTIIDSYSFQSEAPGAIPPGATANSFTIRTEASLQDRKNI